MYLVLSKVFFFVCFFAPLTMLRPGAGGVTRSILYSPLDPWYLRVSLNDGIRGICQIRQLNALEVEISSIHPHKTQLGTCATWIMTTSF